MISIIFFLVSDPIFWLLYIPRKEKKNFVWLLTQIWVLNFIGDNFWEMFWANYLTCSTDVNLVSSNLNFEKWIIWTLHRKLDFFGLTQDPAGGPYSPLPQVPIPVQSRLWEYRLSWVLFTTVSEAFPICSNTSWQWVYCVFTTLGPWSVVSLSPHQKVAIQYFMPKKSCLYFKLNIVRGERPVLDA